MYTTFPIPKLPMCHLIYLRSRRNHSQSQVNHRLLGDHALNDCRTLERLRVECERWARWRGAVFSPTKHELVHLARNPKKLNMAATANIIRTILESTPDIRILGVQIDSRLKWHAHAREMQRNETKHPLALAKIATSTRGATIARA